MSSRPEFRLLLKRNGVEGSPQIRLQLCAGDLDIRINVFPDNPSNTIWPFPHSSARVYYYQRIVPQSYVLPTAVGITHPGLLHSALSELCVAPFVLFCFRYSDVVKIGILFKVQKYVGLLPARSQNTYSVFAEWDLGNITHNADL